MGGICHGGYSSGGFVQGGFVRGVYVLEPPAPTVQELSMHSLV